MRCFWIPIILTLVVSGCATVTRTVDTTPVDLDDDGEAETTRESVTVQYRGSLPPRPVDIMDATDETDSEALELAGEAIDRGMATSVTVTDGSVSVQAGQGYYGTYSSAPVISPSGEVYAAPDVVSTPYGYQATGGGSLPQLQTTTVVHVPSTEASTRPGGEVTCPGEGEPEPKPGTPEHDACMEQALRAMGKRVYGQ